MMSSFFQATAVLTAGLERIPDQLGYLVISEDGVLAVSLSELSDVQFTKKFFMSAVWSLFNHAHC